ncbi:MAG TPA: hypothetical protein VGG33_14245 [Polyangia bacterium]
MHVGLGLLVWTADGWSNKIVIADADAGEGDLIAIGVQEDDVLAWETQRGAPLMPGHEETASVASSAVAITPTPPAPTRMRRSRTAPSTATAMIHTSPPTARVPAPPVRPVRTFTQEPAEAEAVGVGSPSSAGSASVAPPPLQPAAPPSEPPSHASIQAAPTVVRVPAANNPVYVPAEVASYLRKQDSFPSLPASLRRPGAHYLASMEICVAQDGRVSDVGFDRNSPRDLGVALGAAVRGWRYRPLVVDGRASPFCHRLTVSYEIQ